MKKSKPIKEKKIDTIFSKWIRNRDGKCLKCGTKEKLQCAHIFSRVQRSTRWYPDNALTLCYKCHFFWAHKNPMHFADFVMRTLGIKKYKKLSKLFETNKEFSNDEKIKFINKYRRFEL